MDAFFKRSTYNKVHGLPSALDLEKDKPPGETIEDAFKRKELEEEQKRALMNRHLDPLYMETDLPDAPDTGDISFDPNDMTFDFE